MKELEFLREIKSVAFATSENNVPSVRIADVMLVEEDKIYFTTARGKSFYRELIKNPYVSLVGMNKDYKTVRVSGPVKMVGREWVDKIFEANPMMNDLYAGEKRDILDAFCIYEGAGDIFDLSVLPPQRSRFSFGGKESVPFAFKINNNCIACGICKDACPEDAIMEGEPYTIKEEICLECGRCYEKCPSGAIDKRNA